MGATPKLPRIGTIKSSVEKKEIIAALKHAKSITKIVHQLEENLSEDKKDFVEQINKKVLQLESLLQKLKS